MFLKQQASITNANASVETQNEISRLSASLLSFKEAIPFYKIVSGVMCLPNEREITNACGSLNLISYAANKETHHIQPDKNHALEIHKEMTNLSQELK